MRDELVAQLGASDCSGVTTAQLRGLADALLLQSSGIVALKPGDFADLISLEYLRLSSNNLVTLPAGVFSDLASLLELALYGNRLTALPAGLFSGLTELRVLGLHDNSLAMLPEGLFSDLRALETLMLWGNELTALSADTFSGLSALITLGVGDNSLTTLSAGIFSGLAALETLQLDNNGLTTLPAGIFSGLAALETLHLDNNGLTPLSAGIFSGLAALETLHLDNNSLSTLSEGVFSGLGALQVLGLPGNGLTALPAGVFSGLTALISLNLSNNSLMELPAGIFSDLAALRFLHLNDNELTALPAGVFNDLRALRTLDLSGNPGSANFAPLADAGADQAAEVDQVVALRAAANAVDPWGDNVALAWTQTDGSGVMAELTGAGTATPGFVMPAGAAELEFELRVSGRGVGSSGERYIGTDRVVVRPTPDTVVTLAGPGTTMTTDVYQDALRLVYSYSVDDLRGRALTGSIKVAASVDGVAVTPAVRVEGTRGGISILLRRETWPGPDEHLLAVTLSLAVEAAGFALGETRSITIPFSFSMFSTAIAEDGTCRMGMLLAGERCRYRGSSLTMSVMETEPRASFFKLREIGEAVNLEDASNPLDPVDDNIYNLEAVPVGRDYQIIRIYAPSSPQDRGLYDGAVGGMDGATLLLAVLFFLANTALIQAGRRRRFC